MVIHSQYAADTPRARQLCAWGKPAMDAHLVRLGETFDLPSRTCAYLMAIRERIIEEELSDA